MKGAEEVVEGEAMAVLLGMTVIMVTLMIDRLIKVVVEVVEVVEALAIEVMEVVGAEGVFQMIEIMLHVVIGVGLIVVVAEGREHGRIVEVVLRLSQNFESPLLVSNFECISDTTYIK